jgi:hypothetical protein
MNVYECTALIEQIDALAAQNDGVLTEEQMEQIVKAQTQSIQQLGKLCGFMKHLEHGIDACKAEEARIANMRKVASNRLASVKKWLMPYIEKEGKRTVGTFTLSTRKSESVELAENFAELHKEDGTLLTTKTVVTPNKANIKAALKDGAKIEGARLVQRNSLQLK